MIFCCKFPIFSSKLIHKWRWTNPLNRSVFLASVGCIQGASNHSTPKLLVRSPVLAGWIQMFVGSFMWVIEPPLFVYVIFHDSPQVCLNSNLTFILVFCLNSPHLPCLKRTFFFPLLAIHHCQLSIVLGWNTPIRRVKTRSRLRRRNSESFRRAVGCRDFFMRCLNGELSPSKWDQKMDLVEFEWDLTTII